MIDWRRVPGSLSKIEFIDGTYEVSPISQSWDKDGSFNETVYYHFILIGYSVIQDSEVKKP